VPPVRVRAGSWPEFIFALWFAVCLAQLVRLTLSFRHLRGLKRNASAASADQSASLESWLPAYNVRRPVRLLVSRDIAAPIAVGFFRPAVLLPEVLLDELTPVELDHVLLHELAHLARRDDWTNLLTRVAWAVLALHPVAAFALRQIDRERELACDDWVVSATGAPRPYAASLARLFELCTMQRRLLLASGMAHGGSQLGDRIALLLRRGREFTPQTSLLRVGLSTAVMLLFVVAGSRAPAWMTFAQSPAPQPPSAPAVDREPPPAPSTPRTRAKRPSSPERASADNIPQKSVAAPAPAPPAVGPPPAPIGNSLLAALVANGYDDLSIDEIVELKQQGVTPDFIAGIAHSGIGKLRANGIVSLRQQGVRPEYIQDILALGFGPYSIPQFIEFKNQGVPIELFRALKDYGLVHADPAEIREARSHGVGQGSLEEARKYSSTLTLKQIIRLKQAGVI
jgi:beta-lactamase regulating signal transducer with metallopeptidase domain